MPFGPGTGHSETQSAQRTVHGAKSPQDPLIRFFQETLLFHVLTAASPQPRFLGAAVCDDLTDLNQS